jgi:hypothetical protein
MSADPIRSTRVHRHGYVYGVSPFALLGLSIHRPVENMHRALAAEGACRVRARFVIMHDAPGVSVSAQPLIRLSFPRGSPSRCFCFCFVSMSIPSPRSLAFMPRLRQRSRKAGESHLGSSAFSSHFPLKFLLGHLLFFSSRGVGTGTGWRWIAVSR